MATSDDCHPQERIIFFPLVTMESWMLRLCSSGQFSAHPLLLSWAVEELYRAPLGGPRSLLSAGKKERMRRRRRVGAKRRPRDREVRRAARREIICSKAELAPDTLHFLDLEQLILLSNLDRGTRGREPRPHRPLPNPAPPPPTPGPAPRLAGPPGPSPIGARPPGPRGLKRGGGGALPSRAAVSAVRPSCRRSWARSLSLACRRLQRATSGRRRSAARERGTEEDRGRRRPQLVRGEARGRRGGGHDGGHVPAGSGLRHELRGLDRHHRHHVH